MVGWRGDIEPLRRKTQDRFALFSQDASRKCNFNFAKVNSQADVRIGRRGVDRTAVRI